MIPTTGVVRLDLSVPDARALLALLDTSDTFPDVVDALIEALARIPITAIGIQTPTTKGH